MAQRAKATRYHDLDYVLLALIQAHPKISGYQLRGIINESTGYFFHAHLSQIYPSLKQLTADGFIVFDEVAREGKPDLKLYSITPAGTEAVHGWLVKPFEFKATRENEDSYFMKLILMGSLELEEIETYIDSGIEAFGTRARRLAAGDLGLELDFISDIDQLAYQRFHAIWNHELDFMVHEAKARVSWLKSLKKSLRGVS